MISSTIINCDSLVYKSPNIGERIGSFNTVKGAATLPCSAITHTNNRLKKYASLLWVPPKDKKGEVTFV